MTDPSAPPVRRPPRPGGLVHSTPLLAAAACALLVATELVAPTPARGQATYDVVILGGRVMDPETGYDRVSNVGIDGDRIAVVTTDPIRGRREIDATGRIVAPGFIDILSSIRSDPKAQGDKAADGVTSAFGMHGGPLDVAGYTARHAAAGPLINYAATVDHRDVREAAGGPPPPIGTRRPGPSRFRS